MVGNGSEEGGEGYGLWGRARGREGYLWGRNMTVRRCMVYMSLNPSACFAAGTRGLGRWGGLLSVRYVRWRKGG